MTFVERIDPSYRSSKRRTPVGTVLLMKRFRPETELLLIRRTGAHGEGTWAPPGGWVEPGEDPARAACREAWEEVGVTVEEHHTDFLGYTADTHPEGMFGVTLWFFAMVWEPYRPLITNPDRITDIAWVNLRELVYGAPPVAPLFTPVVNGIRKGLIR